MAAFLSYNEDMRRRFGCKVYKLSLDGGMTCPNRDGSKSTGGCRFCSGRGSGDFAASSEQGTEAQLISALDRVRAKVPENARFVAYFQSFTNTYAPVDRLRALFAPLLRREEICGLAIATRPDCLPPETVELLRELNGQKPVWVELGLQTIHEDTARAMNRCYPLSDYDDALRRLTEAGLETVVHVILGLPGETRRQMLETVSYAAHSGAGGIKLQLLHVLRGTPLADDYARGLFRTLEQEEYIGLIGDALRLLRPDMVVHRLTGDGAKRDLIAPLWSADKKRVLNALHAALRRDNVQQGAYYGNKELEHRCMMS